jgi:hypothetical protein
MEVFHQKRTQMIRILIYHVLLYLNCQPNNHECMIHCQSRERLKFQFSARLTSIGLTMLQLSQATELIDTSMFREYESSTIDFFKIK